MKEVLKRLIKSLLILLSFMFFASPYNSNNTIIEYFKYELSTRGLFWLLVLVLINTFFKNSKKQYNKRIEEISTIGSIIYVSLIIIGYYYSNNLGHRINHLNFVLLGIIMLGLFFVIKTILLIIIIKVNNYDKKTSKDDKKISFFEKKYNKKPVLSIFCLLLLFYIPYVIVFYPGTMNMDSLFEIEQFYGTFKWTTHHPIFPTFMYGILMKIGTKIIDNNFGIFLSNIIQLLLSCFVISLSINYIFQNTKNRLFRNILIIIFAFFPIWVINFYSCVKDIWFSISFLLFMVCTMKYYKEEKFTKVDWVLYIMSIIFTILFRNNGLHIMVLSLLSLFFLFDKRKKLKFMICMLFCILFSIIFNMTFTKIYDIKKGSVREVLSIPLQQTSNYVIKYDLTSEEKKVINKIVRIENIKNNYNPETIDYVKANYNNQATNLDLKNYFITWIKMFFKHPKSYVSATLNSTYGYFYPNKFEFKDNVAQLTIDAPKFVNKDNFKISHIEKFDTARNMFIKVIDILRVIPIIGLLFNCGTYTWILILDTLLLLINNKKKILILSPLYFVLLVCVASPVNALVRYMIPIMITIPFISFWIYNEISNENE